jgi:hypothetical protein
VDWVKKRWGEGEKSGGNGVKNPKNLFKIIEKWSKVVYSGDAKLTKGGSKSLVDGRIPKFHRCEGPYDHPGEVP